MGSRCALRFLWQSGRACAKSSPSGAQRFFQYNTMLDFGTPAVLGSPTLQYFNDILEDISNQKLKHDSLGLPRP
jgi:hypothetical protein